MLREQALQSNIQPDSTEVNVNETENNSLLYQPLNRLATLKQWAFELVTLFISVAAFVFMVILMMAVNEKPQPAWAYVVNINTLVAIFTTLLRAAVVLITAEVMGQAKWSWMASPRPLRHVKRFDDASKGAWGSLKFLLHTWKSPPTVLGALIVIASYAIGPFSQQAVKTYPCPIQAEGVARISIAERVAGLDSTRDPGFLSGEMSSVVINGLLSMLPDSSQLFDCDSGNCTFGSISGVTHSSAGVCSKCTDVRSGLLEFDDRGPTVNGRYQPEYRFHNNSDFGINTAVEPILFNMTTSTTYATPFMTSFLTLTAAGCVAKVNEKGQANRYCQHKYENMPKLSSDLDIAAANCTFYPCVRHYEGAITNGTLRERLISDEPMAFRDNLPIEEFYGEYVSMIRPCILNGESYDLSNITSVSRDGLNWTSWSSGGVSYEAPHQCLRVLPELEYVGITNFLADNLKGSCRLFDSSELWYSPDSFEKNYTSINTIGGINSKVKCETGWWLKALHMRGNATFEALAAAHNNMSMAITNRMRANGLTLSTTETSRSYKEGTVNQMSICANVVNTGLPTAAVKSDSNDVHQSHDVIVIGAGFAGLTAARDLSVRGLSVLLLEARDRIGGRTWTAKGQNDDYEMGGGWVHQLQPHIWSEVSRYGLTETKESFGNSPDSLCNIDGNVQSMQDAAASVFPLAEAFFNVDGDGGRIVMPQPTRPLYNREAIVKWDISVEERLGQMDITEHDKELLRMWMATAGLTDVSRIGFLSLLRLYALSGYDFQRYLEANGTFKIPGGTTALADMMFAEFKGASLFNRHVTSIASESTRATVKTKAGEEFSASHVICTVPVHCLADIEFLPPLPPSFTSTVHYNLGGKLHIHSPNSAAKFFGVTTPSKTACFGFTESASKTGGVNIVAFQSSRLEAADRPPLTILSEALDNLKPGSVELGNINEYLWHDWRSDQFSKGAWPVYPAKALSGTLGHLMENRMVSDTLTLAGSDYADGWVGYMDGAIEQGRCAALAIANKLCKSSS
ncbi:monoamine oxidase n [Colletotrichum karsti]|uniref:Amine oxidase n=1 Tax=Colletotrichum karsti TaxID=1095194 RepID=A0A9P6I6Z3_9PEZI|nr:monoamine oxidase n [Colletotrichum karsti]KAF9877503.1 monoamine oxidase n [Colletotrichum karsti]